jgi:hypothetical protein
MGEWIGSSANRKGALLGGKENPDDNAIRLDRFAVEEELLVSVKSVLRFARFVRNIFIVTDSQNPIEFYSDPVFRSEKIHIIDHKDIFPEIKYLPVFDSQAIEACLHNIPGISEIFLYLNDDFFVMNDLALSDFIDPAGQMILDVEKRN